MQRDLERRQAACELLSLPDAPDVRRGHHLRCEGSPDRYALVPQITEAFVQAKLLELGERHLSASAAHRQAGER